MFTSSFGGRMGRCVVTNRSIIIPPSSSAFFRQQLLTPSASGLTGGGGANSDIIRTLWLSPRPTGIFGSSSSSSDEPLHKRVLRKFGWSEYSNTYLAAAGYLMYMKVADEVNYINFFKYCNLEDTFQSWFLVVELHLWMMAARMMQEGQDGRNVRNAMIKALWEDCEMKAKKLEGALVSARKKQIGELGDQLQASFIGYDEGIQGNDTVLAGALWRKFIRRGVQTPKEAEHHLADSLALEMLVFYVRSQYYHLNELSRSQVMRRKFELTTFDPNMFKLMDRLNDKGVKKFA